MLQFQKPSGRAKNKVNPLKDGCIFNTQGDRCSVRGAIRSAAILDSRGGAHPKNHSKSQVPTTILILAYLGLPGKLDKINGLYYPLLMYLCPG